MRSIECGVEWGGGGLVELGEGKVRKGRTQRSPIFLASVKPRLGRALVESCTGSACSCSIVERGSSVLQPHCFGLIAALHECTLQTLVARVCTLQLTLARELKRTPTAHLAVVRASAGGHPLKDARAAAIVQHPLLSTGVGRRAAGRNRRRHRAGARHGRRRHSLGLIPAGYHPIPSCGGAG